MESVLRFYQMTMLVAFKWCAPVNENKQIRAATTN